MELFRNRQKNFFLRFQEGKTHDYYLSFHLGKVAVTRLTKAHATENLMPASAADAKATPQHFLEIAQISTLDRTPVAQRVISALLNGTPVGRLKLDECPVGTGSEVLDNKVLMAIVGDGAARIARRNGVKREPVPGAIDATAKGQREAKGLVPLKTVCAGINVDPRIARKVLRSSKDVKREDGRWEWPKDQVAKVQAVITAGVKQLQKEGKA